MWHKEHTQIRDHVLSHTGSVILLGGRPKTWVKKLQTEIALSTNENEFIELSSATRVLLPLCQLTCNIDSHSFINLPKQTSFTIKNGSLQPSQIHKDNATCIVLATTTTNFKPRAKHISIKCCHFKDQI